MSTSGNTAALETFWKRVAQTGTPLVEPLDQDKQHVLVTFLWRGNETTRNVLIWWPPFHQEATEEYLMTLLGETDVWYRTLRLRREARFLYQLSPNDPLTFGLRRSGFAGSSLATVQRDPLNVRQRGEFSVVELPGAPPQPYSEKRTGVPAGRIERQRFSSRVLANEHDLEIYTPPGYAATGNRYALLIAFDLDEYRAGALVPTPTILDNLIAESRIPPVVALLVGNTERSRELPCNPQFAEFLHQELVPWARKEFHVSSQPERTVVAGSSFGGLAAACAALRHPETFGNVLSQSGSFYWEPSTDPATVVAGRRKRDFYAESNWVAQEIVRRQRLPVRFYLDAGLFETYTTDRGASILESNRRVKDVLRAKGYAVEYKEFVGGHDYLSWRGTFADGLLFVMGRTGRQ